MANRIAGAAFASINGVRYPLVGEAEWQPSGETREPLNGADGFHGFKGKPVNGMMKFKLRDQGDILVADLNDLTDATVLLELANGKSVIGRNMFRTGEPITADAEEGSFEISFAGPDVRD